MDQNRIFYSILQRVGSEGRYQTVSLVIWSLIIMTAGASSFFNAFLFYQDQYKCPVTFSGNCHDYVCSLSVEQRIQYVNKDFSSLSSDFGDYRCEGKQQLDRLQSFIYIGGIVGVLSGAFLNVAITKKKLMIITLIANLLGISTAIFSPSLFLAGIGLFINFAAKCIQMEIIICLITQTVSQNIRGKQTMVIYAVFAMGVSLNGLFFMLIKSWKIVMLLYLILPLIIGLVSLFSYIEETPFDSVTSSSPEQSLATFHRIALRNGLENSHGLTLQQITNIKREYEENQSSKHNYVISILDLFRYKSLRVISILSIILHFLISFEFNAPQLALQDYSLSIYINGMIIGFSEVVSSILCYFIVDSHKRKTVIYITEILAIVSSLPVFLFASCNNGNESCSSETQIIQTFGLFFFRFFITLAYNFFYMIQYQVFPTQIRSLGLQTTAVASYSAVVLVPQIMALCERAGISIIATFTVTCILVMAFTTGTPETFGIAPPQMIEELKYTHTDLLKVNDSIKQKNT